MRQKGNLFALIACILLVLLAVTPVAMADAGNINDYDFDFGGGGSSGIDFNGLAGLFFMLGRGGGVYGIAAVVIIFAVIQIFKARRGAGYAASHMARGAGDAYATEEPVVMDFSDVITSTIISSDPHFSKERFIGWAKEVYLSIQAAWMERDWSRIRPFEKEELFRQHSMQLKEYIDKGRINKMERINIGQAYLHKYEQDAAYEYLTVFMQVRMVDYIIDEKTNRVVAGDPNRESNLRYLLVFTRKTGVRTEPGKSNNSVVACPHCGAPTEITSAGRCEYCGYIVTTGEYDWVLCDMQGVKPGISIDNRGIILYTSER